MRRGVWARHGGAHQKKATHATLPRAWRAAPAPAIHPHPSTRKLAPRRASPRRAHHHQPRPSHAHAHWCGAAHAVVHRPPAHTVSRAGLAPFFPLQPHELHTHTPQPTPGCVEHTHSVSPHARGEAASTAATAHPVSRLATPLRHAHTHDLTADPWPTLRHTPTLPERHPNAFQIACVKIGVNRIELYRPWLSVSPGVF